LLTKLEVNNLDQDGVQCNFQRTCRVPEGRINSLPAGLGSFPIYKVSDFKSGAPKDWKEEGYFFPMYKQEAMWINFSRNYRNPRAMIIAAGNINAITGKPFDLSKDKFARNRRKKKSGELSIRIEEGNYIVTPPQPWIDGWKAEDGKVYQFVAAEMGSGETVEGQITGEEKIGGIQIISYKLKKGVKLIRETMPNEYMIGGGWLEPSFDSCFESALFMNSKGLDSAVRCCAMNSVQSMGLGRGGEISQKIYPDPYGLKVWEPNPSKVIRLYLVSSADFKQVTGHDAPATPVTYEAYQALGLPWFELYDSKYKDIQGSNVFGKLKPVSGGSGAKPNIPENYKPKPIDSKIFEVFK